MNLLGHVGRVAESCAVQSVGDSEVTLSWGEVENKELQHGVRRHTTKMIVPLSQPQHRSTSTAFTHFINNFLRKFFTVRPMPSGRAASPARPEYISFEQ